MGVRMYSILQPTLFKQGQQLNERLKQSIETSMAHQSFGYQELLDAISEDKSDKTRGVR